MFQMGLSTVERQKTQQSAIGDRQQKVKQAGDKQSPEGAALEFCYLRSGRLLMVCRQLRGQAVAKRQN
ncbi:hypothetical protein D3C73_885550 [compost metagenome]